MERFTTEFGGDIAYFDLPGEKAPIVFIHGLGCSSSADYKETASDPLLKEHRRILVDLLGFGFSDRPETFDYSMLYQAQTVSALLDSLGVDRYILFGHSMGGAVAIELADLDQHKILSLIIGEGNLDKGGGFVSRRIARWDCGKNCADKYEHMIDRAYASGNGSWARTLASSSITALYRSSVHLVEGACWRQHLYDFSFPKTYIFGTKSLPDKDEQRLRSDGINVEILADSGHNMGYDNPSGLASLILKNIR